MNSLSLNTPPPTPRVSSGDHRKRLEPWFDCPALRGEKAGREFIALKEDAHLPLQPHTKKRWFWFSSTASSRKGKQGRCRFIHSFKETVLVTLTLKQPRRTEITNSTRHHSSAELCCQTGCVFLTVLKQFHLDVHRNTQGLDLLSYRP